MASRILNLNFPTVDPSGATSARGENIPSDPSMFGGLAARAEEQFGGGLERAGEATVSYATARQELANETHATELNTHLANRYTDRLSEFSQLQGRAALDKLPDFKKGVEQDFQDTMEKAGDNPALRAQLAKSGRYLTDAYYRYGTNHADQQFTHYQNKAADDEAASFGAVAGIAAGNKDEHGMLTALSASDNGVRKRYEQDGYDLDAIDTEVRKNRGKNLRNIIAMRSDDDPVAAKQMFDRFRTQMDPVNELAVANHLRGTDEKIQGEGRADSFMGRFRGPDTVQFLRDRSGARIAGLNQDFAGRLHTAVDDAERATGEKAKIDSLKRTSEEQAALYARYQAGQGGLAAPPGQSLHEKGEAADIHDGKVLDWLHRHASEYGLEFLKGKAFENDSGHIQMAPGGGEAGQTIALAPGGGMPNKGDVMMRVLNDPYLDAHPQAQAAALTRINKVYEAYNLQHAQDIQAFKRRENDAKAEALDTGAVANPMQEDEFMRRYGPEQGHEAFQDYTGTVQLGADMKSLGSMSPEEVAQTFKGYEPQPGAEGYAETSKRRNALQQAYSSVLKQRSDDPGGAAVRQLPAVDAAWTTFQDASGGKSRLPPPAAAARFADITLAEQARIGVPADQQRILPKSVSQALATRWRQPELAKPGKEGEPGGAIAVLSEIQTTARLWGDHWPEVYREIAPKLDPTLRVVAAGVEPAAGVRLLNAQSTPVAKILASEGDVKNTDLRKDVIDALKPFARTVAGSQRDQTVSDYTITAHKLAAIYASGGQTSRPAAAQAVKEIIGGKYDFVDSGESHYRVPKQDEQGKPFPYTVTEISAGTVAAKRKLGTADMPVASKRDDFGGLSPEYLAKETAEGLRQNGVWVTSPKEDGLVLMQGNGFAARRPDGSPFLLSWKDLGELGRTNPKKDNYDLVGFPR